jgi:single stranded DNA-binding protein
MAFPPPPELLEQLGIEPQCMCAARGPAAERAAGCPHRTSALRPLPCDNPDPVKENQMRDIATATLSGNVTGDVELCELPSGVEAARPRVATTTRRRNGEESVEKTSYFTVEAHGLQARACAEHLAKGSRVVVDAELDWREWTDPQNTRREAIVLRARQIVFEGVRTKPAEAVDDQNRAAVTARPGTRVGAAATGGEGPATAGDLPF